MEKYSIGSHVGYDLLAISGEDIIWSCWLLVLAGYKFEPHGCEDFVYVTITGFNANVN